MAEHVDVMQMLRAAHGASLAEGGGSNVGGHLPPHHTHASAGGDSAGHVSSGSESDDSDSGDGGPTLTEALQDVAARFLANLPTDETLSVDRVFSQIQQAHWFYEDFVADAYSHLPHLDGKKFAALLFDKVAMLRRYRDKHAQFRAEFKAYMAKIPVYGGIMLNAACTMAVLVRSYKGKSWTFPRGKINQGENELDCAVREVLEETGFDMGPYVASPNDAITAHIQGKLVKLFIASGVPDGAVFETRTRKEISAIEWFVVESLPTSRQTDMQCIMMPTRGQQPQVVSPKRMYAVSPFVSRLRKWIKRATKGSNPTRGHKKHASKHHAAPKKGSHGHGGGNRGGGKRSGGRRAVSATEGRGGHGRGSGATRSDDETFGIGASAAGFSVDEMFAVNESLSGRKYEYNGDPQSFGLADTGGASTPASRQGKDRGRRRERNGGSSAATASPATHGRYMSDEETFGAGASAMSWSVDDMFRTNEEILGKKFTYDGNPQNFGVSGDEGAASGGRPPQHTHSRPPKPTPGRRRGKGRKDRGGKRGGNITSDDETFGAGASQQSWSVDEMFRANEIIRGVKYVYDGNPQHFGVAHDGVAHDGGAATEAVAGGTGENPEIVQATGAGDGSVGGTSQPHTPTHALGGLTPSQAGEALLGVLFQQQPRPKSPELPRPHVVAPPAEPRECGVFGTFAFDRQRVMRAVFAAR